ncbi:MAG: permease [Trueperaceae bacterium]|nr:permease [Trueperaceae bacterium]
MNRVAGRAQPRLPAGAIVATAAAVWLVAWLGNEPFFDWLVFGAVGLVAGTRLGDAVHFFLYDSVKIMLLLSGVIFAIGVLRSFVSVERTRALLGGRRQGAGNVLAALLGVATPFCSCSAVPVFIGFVSAGVPLGVTLSFLIASPLVDVVTITLLLGLFGWKVAAIYVAAGLTLAISVGMLLGRMNLERWVEPFVFETRVGTAADPAGGLAWRDRFVFAKDEVVDILRRIWPFLLVGIGLGAAIHGWVPEAAFASWAGPDQPLAVPIAVLLGIPLYANVAGVLPLIEALHAKGLALGTLLAFMMAVVALSLPETVLLRRVLKPRLIALFIVVVGSGVLLLGLGLNLLAPTLLGGTA